MIFRTNKEEKLIVPEIESDLYAFMGGVFKNLECPAVIIGGHYDHVHCLVRLSPKVLLIKLIEDVKKASSKWMKEKGISNFFWQRGYGAFSVNPSEIDVVMKYIKGQHKHHQTKTFKDEYLAFLKKYDVDFDERFLWE